MGDSYFTVRDIERVEYRVKDSRFYATLYPVSSQKDVNTYLEKVKDELPGASHHVYAYNYLEGERSVARESDDGEPAGSSGPPLARVLKGTGLSNVMVVVTRYFGGTKLGLGGLARAYSQAGRLVLDEAEVIEVIILYSIEVEVEYSLLGDVLKVIERSARIIDVGYREGRALVKGTIKSRDLTSLKREIKDASRGQALLSVPGKKQGEC